MGFMDKIKDVAGKNPDKVDKVTEKATDAFNERTDGKFAEHTDTAWEKAGEFLKGDQGGSPDQPPAGEQPPA